MLVLTFGLCAGALSAIEVHAQTGNCAAHATVVERLATRYGESRQSMGLGFDNSVIEVFASDDTGTWTITVTRPGGLTCMVAAGQSYQRMEEVVVDQDT
ncbi:MAG: hypothetical protein AAFU41_12905 [Pseudomonadota bacterium]